MRDIKTRTVATPQGLRPLADVLEEYPPDKRASILRQLAQIERKWAEDKSYVDGIVRETLEVPATIYKYMPLNLLDKGCPFILRATQPLALNDVMEANVVTLGRKDMDRDEWYSSLCQALE